MNRWTLSPLDCPGILHRGSPVICDGGGTPTVDAGRAVVVSLTEDFAVCAWGDTEDEDGPSWAELPISRRGKRVADPDRADMVPLLDLDTRVGAAQAVWWFRANVGPGAQAARRLGVQPLVLLEVLSLAERGRLSQSLSAPMSSSVVAAVAGTVEQRRGLIHRACMLVAGDLVVADGRAA